MRRSLSLRPTGANIDMTLPESALSLMQALKKAGFQNPVLHGGALRDTFRQAAFNDLDIRAGIVSAFDLTDAAELAWDKFDSIHGVEVIKRTSCGSYGHEEGAAIDAARFQVEYVHDNAIVKSDITVIKGIPNTSKIAISGDAPINSIAADLTGNIFAHPRFKEDMEAGIYRVLRHGQRDKEASIKRYDAIATRFKGLQLVL